MSIGKSAYGEVWKWLAVAIAITLMGVVSSAMQSGTYTKSEVDREVDRVVTLHNRDVDRMYDGIDQIQQNVDWLVRQQGGEPIRSETEEDR